MAYDPIDNKLLSFNLVIKPTLNGNCASRQSLRLMMVVVAMVAMVAMMAMMAQVV